MHVSVQSIKKYMQSYSAPETMTVMDICLPIVIH